MDLRVVLVFAVIMFLASVSSAATCAEKAYYASCTKCTFDSNGKMNQTCYNNEQNAGKTCLFTAYPIESTEYSLGNCPAIDVCINRLQECKALYTTGNDEEDCASGSIDHCFVAGDICVAEAVKNCSGVPPTKAEFDVPPAGWCDSYWFTIVPIFIGVIIFNRKK